MSMSPPFKRQFETGVLLTSYAIFDFPDARRIKTFGANSDPAQGTLLRRKTRKQHGIDWPWGLPLMGITGTAKWVHQILDFCDIA